MDNKQIQQWLKDMGYYKGNIDGIIGNGTKAALKQAQQYLSSIGLYLKNIDGKIGQGTIDAITKYNKGNVWYDGIKANRYDRKSLEKVITTLKNKGYKAINTANGSILLNKNFEINDAVNFLGKGFLDVADKFKSNARIQALNNTTVNTETIKQVQQWLKDRGWYNGNIDGIFGSKSTAALKKGQEWLNRLHFDAGTPDGTLNSKTLEALRDFTENGLTVHGITFNRGNARSVESFINQANKKGINLVTIDGHLIDINKQGAVYKIMGNGSGAESAAESPSLGSMDNWKDVWKNGTKNPAGSVNAASSYGSVKNDLSKLYYAYMFDKYHRKDVNNDEWGISVDYDPTALSHGISGVTQLLGKIVRDRSDNKIIKAIAGKLDKSLTLKIDNGRYDINQAQQIARGAGVATFTWGGKKYNTNLFVDTNNNPICDENGTKLYNDKQTFDSYIKGLQAKDPAKAQEALNKERARQYSQFGTDYTMLNDKSIMQMNTLFGVIPYGYSPGGILAILRGEQSTNAGNTNAISSALTSVNADYRGTYNYNDFNGWWNSRINNNNYRNSTSAFAVSGVPVTLNNRGKLSVDLTTTHNTSSNGTTSLDTLPWYNITDENNNPNIGRGNTHMQARLYQLVKGEEDKPGNEGAQKKHQQAVYEYLKAIFGDRSYDKNGVGTTSRTKNDFKNLSAEEIANLTALSSAAGLPSFHLGTGYFNGEQGKVTKWIENDPIGAMEDVPDWAKDYFNMPTHDRFESLQNFYLNGFDENGQLKSDFDYFEPGYDQGLDAGAFTSHIRGGNNTLNEDSWNADMFGVNIGAGEKGRGFYVKNKPTVSTGRYGGRLAAISKLGGVIKYIM